MGADAILYVVHQDGTSPRRRRLEPVDGATDVGDVVARLPETHPGRLTSRIKPYGSLVLYPDEMGDLVVDLERIWDTLASRDRPTLSAFIALARRCADEPRSELHLDGD